MSKAEKTKSKWQIILLAALFFAASICPNSCSAKKTKVYKVGILCSFAPFMNIADGFKAEMTKLGYIEGQNIVYDLQIAHMDPKAEKKAARKFVENRVDLIFAFSTEAAITAKSVAEDTGIPVVFAMAGIEGNNLVQSIHRPGGNITGVRYTGPENTIKRFELLRELVPNIKRLYVTYNKNYPANKASLEALRPAVSLLGVTLVETPITKLEDIQIDLNARAASENIDIDAILIMPDDLSQSPDGFGTIVNFAKKHKIPIGGGADCTADLGAMFSFVPDFYEIGKIAAAQANKIFKGTPAGEIMVVTAADRLRLNYKVIRELGLKASESLIIRADEIMR